MPYVHVQQQRPASRVMRRPQHTFHIRQRPWQIQPFMIAPVLPGETLKNLLLQARVVTDPIKNPLIGWWQEYYFFYVKHRDLAQRDHFTAMVLDPGYDMSALDAAAAVEHYHAGGGIDWVDHCLDCVVDHYFRNEGEAVGDFTIGNLPAASIAQQTWLDSVVNDADLAAEDLNVDLDSSGTVMASEVEAAMRQYQFMRHNGLTEMSYEDFLQTYGVRPAATELHKPELVRYIRDWTYPSNTIDPTDGSPSSACSWSIAERADKDRFFAEPGFLFGVSVSRPKVYLSGQAGSAAILLSDAFAWLPAVLRDDPATSLKKVAGATTNSPSPADAPLTGVTDDYWVDVRDLFLYGEQFVNFALTETDAGLVALPTAGLQKRYAAATDADALFASASPLNQVRQDGVVSLGIAGSLIDATPTQG